MSDDAHIDHAKLQQRHLVYYESPMGPRFSSAVWSSERQAQAEAELFTADGYPARVMKVTVENGQPVSQWMDAPDPSFSLHYTTDPHARVALEAYADSVGDEDPRLASDLYRALGIDVEVAPVDLDEELCRYLARVYRGRWVAVRERLVIAVGDSLDEVRTRVTGGQRFTVLQVPRDWAPCCELNPDALGVAPPDP